MMGCRCCAWPPPVPALRRGSVPTLRGYGDRGLLLPRLLPLRHLLRLLPLRLPGPALAATSATRGFGPRNTRGAAAPASIKKGTALLLGVDLHQLPPGLQRKGLELNLLQEVCFGLLGGSAEAKEVAQQAKEQLCHRPFGDERCTAQQSWQQRLGLTIPDGKR